MRAHPSLCLLTSGERRAGSPYTPALADSTTVSTYLDGDGPRAFAHRGWHTGDYAGLENTAVAFGKAFDEGYRYLETDVHVTADGKLIAFHDHILDRVTDQKGRVSALTWDQIRRARIAGREPIPLLADLLGDFPDAKFNIDPKTDRAIGPLIDVLRATNATDRVCLGSFSDRRLIALRSALGPSLATSMGPREVTAMVARGRRVPLWRYRGSAVAAQVPMSQGPIPVVSPGFITAAHRLGIEIHVWTVDDPAVMHRLLDAGVDGILTDRPDLLREVLTARGSWPS